MTKWTEVWGATNGEDVPPKSEGPRGLQGKSAERERGRNVGEGGGDAVHKGKK